MGIAASDLNQQIIRPTLLYLNRQSTAAEALLLGVAACQSSLGAALDNHSGFGLYRITQSHHQHLWDDRLAANPDLASLVRGLASQHAFLGAPHLELTVNLRYATAIAWLLIEHHGQELPAADDLGAQALIWQAVFAPYRKPNEFVCAWQRCILGLASTA
ncbi:hypothetical protein [Phytopseudomonas punonensis]|uniref:Uncharacterized protein n=1 Tax=Phytopseudomonas punonensis TaxID=1220495 RepID=A0A1M7NB52_9GAMM|nr:hypothetical protein [Pseudomonas punonensis]SHN00786.1 hypothetical protein SAMN05216288_0259 [Pseudomonas punonensis]